MGLCKSCFSRKPLGSSPEQAGGEPDAQMLIVRSGSQQGLVSAVEPSSLSCEEPTTTVEDKLERSETGDSGTCVDEDNPKDKTESKENIIDVEDDDARRYKDVRELEEAGDVDLVQLTVSSVASFGAVLEDVPEHCELGADVDPDMSACEQISYSEQDTVTTQLSFNAAGLSQIPETGDDEPLINFSPNIDSDKENSPLLILEDSQTPRKESFSSVLKPIVKPSTQSFGSARSYPTPPLPDGNKAASKHTA